MNLFWTWHPTILIYTLAVSLLVVAHMSHSHWLVPHLIYVIQIASSAAFNPIVSPLHSTSPTASSPPQRLISTPLLFCVVAITFQGLVIWSNPALSDERTSFFTFRPSIAGPLGVFVSQIFALPTSGGCTYPERGSHMGLCPTVTSDDYQEKCLRQTCPLGRHGWRTLNARGARGSITCTGPISCYYMGKKIEAIQ